MVHSDDYEPSKSIFLHHIDDFEINAIKKRLMEENITTNCTKYDLYGSTSDIHNLSKVMHSRQPLQILNPASADYIEKIIACDYIVYNADSPHFESICSELRKVFAGLEKWADEQRKLIEQPAASSPDIPAGSPPEIPLKKYLILISPPMTWALSEPSIVVNDEEENNEMSGYILEEDYRRRKALKTYCKHKLLERDVIWLQKKCRHFVRSLVVCPGVTYGAENERLHYLFKLAFYNKEVPVLRPGTQFIPMIYIKDFVDIMKNIFDNFPEAKHRYIFAVHPTLMRLKTFTYQICKSFNGDCSKIRFLRNIELLMLDRDLFPPFVLDAISLNLKLYGSYLKDFPFHEITPGFFDILAQEFRDERNLHPLKLVLDGPPLVGKTEHALKLAIQYQLIYIDIREIMRIYIKYLEQKISDSIFVVENFECPEQILLEGEEGGEEESYNRCDGPIIFDEEDHTLISGLKNRIAKWSKELFQLKVYIASHKAFEDQEFKEISRCLISLISTKQYNENQGYVIDGFPFTYKQADQIYYNTRQIEEVTISLPDLTDEQAMADNSTPILKPTHFIMFDAHDDLLCKRAMDFTETEATIRRCLRHQMLPRLEAYRERTDEPNCLANIFFDNDLIPITHFIDGSTCLAEILRTIKLEIGHPFIYPLSMEEQKARQKIKMEARLKKEEEQRRKKETFIKALTAERERKVLEWTAKYEEIRKHENELREVKTLPLRQYLGKYILPTLTEGILKVAELKPEDPIDFLADYLFKFNPEGQQMPPFCTQAQRKRFMDNFYDTLTSDSDYFIDNDKN